MTLAHLTAVHWPHVPPFPALGEPVLLRVPTTAPRATARQQLRTATRTLLAAWANLPASALKLQETAHGPVYPTALHGHPVAFSFSYTTTDAWLALTLDASIGLDALLVQPFAEIESVARLYLSPAALAEINSSANPANTFARHWTTFEARLKFSRRPLTEWPSASFTNERESVRECRYEAGETVVTVVT